MLKTHRLALLVFTLTWFSPTYAQEKHVELRYFKDTDRTVASSDLLYVVNMPSQFMQLQLVGRYPKQGKPQGVPDKINLVFFSYATQTLYQMDDAHRLRIKVDDQILDLGLLGYAKLEEKKDDTKKTNSGVRPGLSSSALIAANRNNPLVVETMSTSAITLADLTTMARAQNVIFRIGDTVFPLKPMHQTILREFVDAITPANVDSTAARPEAPVKLTAPADVPSEDNQAPLDQTLSWLKKQIEHEGSTKDPVVERKLEPLDFKSCRVSYRVVPLFSAVPVSTTLVYSILEYQVNLADLNPEAVGVANLSNYSTVSLATRNLEKKILIYQHANQNGSTGRTLKEGSSAYVQLKFKSSEAADNFKFALVHAINLCQSQPAKMK